MVLCQIIRTTSRFGVNAVKKFTQINAARQFSTSYVSLSGNYQE